MEVGHMGSGRWGDWGMGGWGDGETRRQLLIINSSLLTPNYLHIANYQLPITYYLMPNPVLFIKKGLLTVATQK